MSVAYIPLDPWLPGTRAAVLSVAVEMADLDHDEIFGLRPRWHTAENVVEDVAAIVASRRLLDGLVAFRDVAGQAVPFVVAMAFRSSMPGVAEIALFGRRGHARAVPEVYREIASRMVTFGTRHRVTLAQVPILSSHRAARRMAASLGGTAAFDYGPVGIHGQAYTHTIWRF